MLVVEHDAGACAALAGAKGGGAMISAMACGAAVAGSDGAGPLGPGMSVLIRLHSMIRYSVYECDCFPLLDSGVAARL